MKPKPHESRIFRMNYWQHGSPYYLESQISYPNLYPEHYLLQIIFLGTVSKHTQNHPQFIFMLIGHTASLIPIQFLGHTFFNYYYYFLSGYKTQEMFRIDLRNQIMMQTEQINNTLKNSWAASTLPRLRFSFARARLASLLLNQWKKKKNPFQNSKNKLKNQFLAQEFICIQPTMQPVQIVF